MIELVQPKPLSSPFRARSLHTQDADEHAACLKEWGQCYDQLSAGRFAGDFEEFWFGHVQIFRERANQSIHESGSPWAGSRTFAVPVEVDGTGWFAGRVFDMESMITLKGGDTLDFRTPRQHELIAVSTDSEALNRYALEVDHRDLEAELKDCIMVPTSQEDLTKMRHFLQTVMSSLRATPEILRHEQMQRALEHAIFGTILETVVPDRQSRSTPSGRTRQIVVDRAREFMREHIEDPISVADLCVQLRVSRRTLQYSFQTVLDLNPVKFLRAMRLNGVRRALKRADPLRGDTVADIAARWGFWHLSHFAADYRNMFDELPSDTLKRAGQAEH